MRMHAHRWFLGLAALIAIPATGSAQKRPVELGIDGAISYDFTNKVTEARIPIERFRVGFFASDAISVEPSLAFRWDHVTGATTTDITAGLGLLYHLTKDPMKSRVFVEPVASVTHSSGGGSSETQFSAGGGLGVKVPAGNRLAVRLEALFAHAFAHGGHTASNEIVGLFGFSFFTR